MAVRPVLRKRYQTGRLTDTGLSFASIVLALAASALLFFLLGVPPFRALWLIFSGALGSWYGVGEVVVKTIPLALCGIAVALAFRMQVWNIGAEGQIYVGALAAAAVVRYCAVDSFPPMLLMMTAGAAFAGGLWGGAAGYLKARWNVNEIITTLMMNYIAIHLMDYFIYGPWRDPASLGFPMTAPFPPAARLPMFFDSRVHLGIILAFIALIIFRIVLRWTRWGFEIRVIGENPKAARYAGIPIMRNIILVLFLSGAIAGIAGMCEVAGLQGRLQHGFSPGYGYTAIIVAWLGRLNPWGIALVAFFMGTLLVGGETLQVLMRLPLASTQVMQGLILFSVLAMEFFRNYKVILVRDGGR